MADERTTPVNPKWGPLPESLSDKTRKKKPCEDCGKMTPGSMALPKIRVDISGNILPLPRHLCWDCQPAGARKKLMEAKALERKNESYRGHA